MDGFDLASFNWKRFQLSTVVYNLFFIGCTILDVMAIKIKARYILNKLEVFLKE